MNSLFKTCVATFCLSFVVSASALADVQLPRIFTDNMVVQQQMPIRIWGWADAGEAVSVSFDGQSAKTTADETGAWRVELSAMDADGKPHTLKVVGENTIERRNMLLGEVWLCAGQSNMNREATIEEATPNVRLFWIAGSTTPQEHDLGELVFGWTPATPGDVAPVSKLRQERVNRNHKQGFAEVGYVFGLKLHKELKVPVGLIKCAFGGSQVQAWTPRADLADEYPFGVKAEGGYIGHRAGLLYQSMVHGFAGMSMRGVVWYQGENDGRSPEYRYAEDLEKWIASWRKIWGQDDLPFYMAQIAQTSYASGMLRVYESQVRVMESDPHVAVASSNDLQDKSMRADEGNAQRNMAGTGWPIVSGGNPHPPNKHIVAERLADIALAKTYGKIDREVLPPVYDSHDVEGNKLIVTFKHAGAGLKTDDGKAPNWFEISDGERKGEGREARLQFVKADARIVGKDTVELTAEGVDQPKLVRFAWHMLARHNLYNTEGLPAISFRSEGVPAKR